MVGLVLHEMQRVRLEAAVIYRIGDGPWLLKVQAPTYSYDVPITEEMMKAIMAMVSKAKEPS